MLRGGRLLLCFVKRAIDFGDYTDVKVKGGYVEVCFVDNECDLVYLSASEYKSRYGEC